MTNQDIANLLQKVAATYTLKGENRFRTIAYENAADSISRHSTELKKLWKEGRLGEVQGVGKGIADHLDELFKTGRVKHFDIVLKDFPPALFELLDVPGLGAKRAFTLVKTLGLKHPETAVEDLLHAAKSGRIAMIAGYGEKSQEDIIDGLMRFKKGQIKENRMPLPYAHEMADEVLAYLKKIPKVLHAVPLGSLRRMVATIGDIDIAVATNEPDEVIEWFIKYPAQVDIIERGPTGASILLGNGRQIDLRVQSPLSFGAMVQYFTGSKRHNIKLREYALKKGLSLNEYGIKLVRKVQSAKFKAQSYNAKLKIYEFPSEEGFYEALSLPWIPPEIREDRGEIEAAHRSAQGKLPGLPELIELKNIKGDFHIHTDYPIESSHDVGASSLQEILRKADALDYEYIGLSDHNPSISKHAENEIITILKKRKEYYEHIHASTKSTRVKIFIMLEIDIQPDGKLAIPNEGFDYLDAAIVSVHSSFGQNRKDMTKRVLSGLSHPKAKILAHPTGRLLGKRVGYELDWEQVFAFCIKHNKAIEINAYPERLDLPDELVREAISRRVKLTIDTDSHAKEHLNLMKYGVSVARRGWAEKSDIINAMTYNEVKKWLTGV